MKQAALDAVAPLMEEAAATAILPRFRLLADDEVEEKSPGEVVTVADREAEAILTAGLTPLLPGSRVLGEEACSLDPTRLDGLADGLVWLVDPLDGTANFAAGEPVFAVMVALLRDGETIAGWMLNPVTGDLARAERGAGAWLDDERLEASAPVPGQRLRGSIGRFMPEAMQADVTERLRAGGELLPGLKCAGVEYPMIGAAERDFAFYWRTIAWDHAPGVLFLNEAGGKAARPDGSAYAPGSAGSGLLVARHPEVWATAKRMLID